MFRKTSRLICRRDAGLGLVPFGNRYDFGDGPYSASEVESFGQFLRQQSTYGAAPDRFRCARTIPELIMRLEEQQDEWMSIGSSISLLQLLANQKMIECSMGVRMMRYLIDNSEKMSQSQMVTTLLTGLGLISDADCAIMAASFCRFEEDVSVSDLLQLSKTLRVICSLTVRDKSLAPMMSAYAQGLAVQGIRILRNVDPEASSVFSEQVSTLLWDVSTNSYLFQDSTCKEFVLQLLAHIDAKIGYLKTHHMVLIVRGLADGIALFEREATVSLCSRIIDRLQSLLNVFTFTEFSLFIDAMSSIVAELRRMSKGDAKVREDVVDMELELASLSNKVFRGLAFGLSKNLLTNPDDCRVPSRQTHVQRHIPSRAELLTAIRGLDRLCIASPSEAFLWLHGSMIDALYKSENTDSIALGATQSGIEAIDMEMRKVLVMDGARPCHTSMSVSEGSLSFPFRLRMSLDWVPFGTKYRRANRIHSEDALTVIRQLQLGVCNSLSERKVRYFPALFFLSVLIADSSNVELLRMDQTATQAIASASHELTKLGYEADGEGFRIDPARRFETMLALFTFLQLSLTDAYLHPVKSAQFTLVTAKSALAAASEGLLRGFQNYSICEDDVQHITSGDLILYVSMLFRENILARLPFLMQRALVGELTCRLPLLHHGDFHDLQNHLCPLFVSSNVRRIIVDESLDPSVVSLLIDIKREALSRLVCGLDQGISFATDVPYARWLGIAIGEGIELSDSERGLSQRVVGEVIRLFKRQCISSDLLIKASEELECLMARNRDNEQIIGQRATFHAAVIQCTSSLLKGSQLSFADGLRLLRAFHGNRVAKGFRENLQAKEGGDVRDEMVFALHEEMLKGFAEIPCRDYEFTLFPLLLDGIGALHKSQRRAFFSACGDNFLMGVRSSSLVQKAHFGEWIAETFSSNKGGRNRVPWALSEYLHHHSMSPRVMVNILGHTKDRSFNNFTLMRLARRVPVMPVSNLITLIQFPLISNAKPGQLAYLYLAERLLEVSLGVLSLRSFSVKAPESVRANHRHFARFSNLAPPIGPDEDAGEWSNLIQDFERFRVQLMESCLGQLTFEHLAGILGRSHTQAEGFGRVSDSLQMAAIDAMQYVSMGYDKMSEDDVALRDFFHNNTNTFGVANSHITTMRRNSLARESSLGVLSVLLFYPDDVRSISKSPGDGTAYAEGYSLLCDALSREKYVLTEPHFIPEAALKKVRRERAADLAKLRKLRKGRVREGKVRLWCNANKPFVKHSNGRLSVKLRWFLPARVYTPVSVEAVEREYGSLLRAPTLLPYFRQQCCLELKSLPRLMGKGQITSFNAFTLMTVCDAFGEATLLKRCLKAFAGCPIHIKEGISVRGLSSVFGASASSPSQIAVRDACLSHLVQATDEAFGRTIATVGDIVMLFQHSREVLLSNVSFQRRVMNRLDLALPHASHREIVNILTCFKQLEGSVFADDMRLILSRAPLYVCNDVSQYSGSALIDVCYWLNETRLLGQTTLDAIIEKVECSDDANEERWVPSGFEGTLTYGGAMAFSKERARVLNALKGLTIKAEETLFNADDTIE